MRRSPTEPKTETLSTRLPFNSPPPEEIDFANRLFNITGKFAYGSRQIVVDAISQKGGIAKDAMPSHDSNYLVIGVFASRDWVHTNFGRKIERAIELRDSGSGLVIICEEFWKKFLG